MKPIQSAVNVGFQITRFNIDLAQYVLAQLGSKVGVCQVSEFKELEQSQEQQQQSQEEGTETQLVKHDHPTHLKVHFLKQFSKYWIIHNVGQDIIISYEEFYKIISKYAKFYNEKSDKLLKDFYDSAHSIWEEYIKRSGKTPTTRDIKHAILKIVAHTLHKDVDQEHEDNFGDQLYNIFKQYIEQDLKVREKPIVKLVKEKFDHSDYVKACKEYTKFFKDFIQEFFPHKEYDLSHTRLFSFRKIRKVTNKVLCSGIMMGLNNFESFIDLAFLFENSVKENIASKLNIKRNIKDINLDKLVEADRSDLSISDNENSSSFEPSSENNLGMKKILRILERNTELSEKQRKILLQEETIKNKLQIIALKLFIIGQKSYSYYKRVTFKKTYNFMNRDNIYTVLYESKNCAVNLSYVSIQKVQNYYKVFITYGGDVCQYYIDQIQKLPQIITEHFQQLKKAKENNGLLGVLFYEKSLLQMRKNKQIQKEQGQLEEEQNKSSEQQKEQQQEQEQIIEYEQVQQEQQILEEQEQINNTTQQQQEEEEQQQEIQQEQIEQQIQNEQLIEQQVQQEQEQKQAEVEIQQQQNEEEQVQVEKEEENVQQEQQQVQEQEQEQENEVKIDQQQQEQNAVEENQQQDSNQSSQENLDGEQQQQTDNANGQQQQKSSKSQKRKGKKNKK